MRLSGQDASFLYGETAFGPMHASGVAVLEGELPFEKVLAHIQSRLHLVPRYRQRLAFVPFNLAHAKWVDDPEFELANHVKLHKLKPGSTLEDALQVALELGEGLLDRSRPLWMSYVLEGVPDRTVMVSLSHHAMIDGASGVDLSLVLMDLSPDAPPVEPPSEPWKPEPVPRPLELLSEAVQENLSNLFQSNPFESLGQNLGAERASLMRTAVEVSTRLATQPVIGTPWNASIVGPKRKLEWLVHELAEFKPIRQKFGGTVNDVVLAVVTEGAARYLEHHEENTRDQYMRLMCPVNVRREEEAGQLGNRVAGMFPTLPAWSMPIRERLEAVIKETSRLKEAREPEAIEMMMSQAPAAAPVAMAQTLLVGTPLDLTARLAANPPPVPPKPPVRPPHFGYNFVCTNVPGIQQPFYMAGHKVLDVTGAIMLTGVLGYGVAVGSYDNRMYMSFTSDPRLLPDLRRMRDYVEEAFVELAGAADGGD